MNQIIKLLFKNIKININNIKRVNEGEKYYLIRIDVNGVKVYCHKEENYESDKRYFENNNYFHTKEKAESVARKLRAVLNGADVIEIPSKSLGLTEIKNNHLRGFIPERLSLNDLKAFAIGFWEGCNWLTSKIVK